MSKNRNLLSPDVKAMRSNKEIGMRMHFCKKSDDEGDEFYYLGELTAISEKFVDTSMLAMMVER